MIFIINKINMATEVGIFASNFFIVIGTFLFLIILLVIVMAACSGKKLKHEGKFLKLTQYKNLYETDLEVFNYVKKTSQKTNLIPSVVNNNNNEKFRVTIDGWEAGAIKEWFPKKRMYIVYNFDNFKKSNKWDLYTKGTKSDEITDLAKFVDVVANTCDPKTHIIILKISSGGGYAYAFEYGYTQLLRLKNQGFKIIGCVDDICASGGYMLASVCDKIFASPFAQIGSVGVIGQTYNYAKLINEHGVEELIFKTGKHKAGFPTGRPYTDEDIAIQQEDIAKTLEVFKSIVTRHRGEAFGDNLDKILTADVWYSREALDMGLIDGIINTDDLLFQINKRKSPIYLASNIGKDDNGFKGILSLLTELVKFGNIDNLTELGKNYFQQQNHLNRYKLMV
jgi:signal peptide peptidase SppA